MPVVTQFNYLICVINDFHLDMCSLCNAFSGTLPQKGLFLSNRSPKCACFALLGPLESNKVLSEDFRGSLRLSPGVLHWS